MTKRKMQVVKDIPIECLKSGQLVRLEGGSEYNIYILIKRGNIVRFYPLNSECKEFNIRSLNFPIIKDVFDGGSGKCLYHKIDEAQEQENEDFEKFIGDVKED